MSHRKAARNKSSSSIYNPLAKSSGGNYVLVQQKNGLLKVLLPEQCCKEELLVLENRPKFNPPDHKKKLRAAKYHEISPCVVITYGKTRKLVVYNLKISGIQWLTYYAFKNVLETKEGPDIDKFRLLLKKLPAGVDSGKIPASDFMDGRDVKAAVSEVHSSGPWSNESKSKTLSDNLAYALEITP
jgi:hypothetical protein